MDKHASSLTALLAWVVLLDPKGGRRKVSMLYSARFSCQGNACDAFNTRVLCIISPFKLDTLEFKAGKKWDAKKAGGQMHVYCVCRQWHRLAQSQSNSYKHQCV